MAISLPPSGWRSRPALIRSAIYTLGLLPAVISFTLAFTDRLGADPVKTLEHDLGTMALRFLIAGLAITPLRKIGGPNLVRYRRAVGLLAFAYAVLHVTVWLWLDRGLDGAEIWKDLAKRPYIMVGMLTFLILLPLAATSTNGMIRRLGAANWQRLHKWVYVAAVAACIHFILAVKAWPPEPLTYAAITAGLLGWRTWDAWRTSIVPRSLPTAASRTPERAPTV